MFQTDRQTQIIKNNKHNYKVTDRQGNAYKINKTLKQRIHFTLRLCKI